MKTFFECTTLKMALTSLGTLTLPNRARKISQKITRFQREFYGCFAPIMFLMIGGLEHQRGCNSNEKEWFSFIYVAFIMWNVLYSTNVSYNASFQIANIAYILQNRIIKTTIRNLSQKTTVNEKLGMNVQTFPNLQITIQNFDS